MAEHTKPRETQADREALVKRLLGMKATRYTHLLEATGQIIADGKRIAELEKALRFYAAWGVFAPFHDDAIIIDGGKVARTALRGAQ